MTKINKVLFLLVFGLLVGLEIFCANLAFETLGEITSGILSLFVALNIIPLILLLKNKITLATIFIIIIALILVPQQLYLGKKLIDLKEEGANIVAYLYEQKIETGNFPSDLSGYTFSFPKLQKHFTYYKEFGWFEHPKKSNQAFHLLYFVGTKNTSHFYYSRDQKWGEYIARWAYYPD